MAISASQTSTLFIDLDNDGVLDPGDTVLTSVVITNSAGPAATGVSFNEALNGMTMVNGTLNVSPLALDDFYNAVGNTRLVVGTVAGAPAGPAAAVAGSVVANDMEFLGDTFVISAFDALSANGGTVELVTAGVDRGSFSYLPAVGFTGTDSFTYTIRDQGVDGIAGNADDLTSVGTVTITVSNLIWYVDNSAAPGGDGRSSSPFDSLSPLNGAGGAGDVDGSGEIIFVRTGSGNYTTGITLENAQTLWGENEALVVGGYTLQGAGADPTITNAAGSGVTLAAGNTLKGFTVGDTAVADIVDGNASVGNLTISNVNLTGTGQAIDIDQGGNLNVTLDTLISTSSAAQGVQLAGTATSGPGLLSGTFTATTGAISGSAGTAFLVGDGAGGANTGGTLTITYGGSITSTFGRAIGIQDRAAGAGDITFSGDISHTNGDSEGIFLDDNAAGNITFSGAANAINTTAGAAAAVSISNQSGGTVLFSNGGLNIDTTAGAGVSLTNNTGGTINFTGGGLTIDTTSGSGLSATGGGTLSVQGAGNTIHSTSATALNVVNTTIGAAGLTFQSISAGNADGAPDPLHGIVLNNTGSAAGLSVTGDAGGVNNASGGTLQNTTGAGISLINTRHVALDQLSIQNTGDSGINGTGVTDFTFTNGAITNAGNAGFESAIGFNGVGATPGLGNNINGTLTVTGSTFTNAFYGGVDVRGNEGTITNANVSGNTIVNPGGSGISFVGTGDAVKVFNLNNATIDNNNIGSRGNGIQIAIENLAGGGPAAHAGFVTFEPTGPKPASDPNHIISITGNTIALDATGTNAIILTNTGATSSRGQMNFELLDNTLSGSPAGSVVVISSNGSADTAGVVDNNIVDANHTATGFHSGIVANAGPGGAGNVWDPQLNLTLTSNTITETDLYGIYLSGRGAAGESYLTVANNSVAAPLYAGPTPGIFVQAGDGDSLNDQVYLKIFDNTSAGNGVDGIGLLKQGNDPAVNVFAIFDAAGGPTLADSPTNAQVEAFLETLNPAGNGAIVLVGENFVRFDSDSDVNVFGPYIPLLASDGGVEAASPRNGSLGSDGTASPVVAQTSSTDSGTPPGDTSNDPATGSAQPGEAATGQSLGTSTAVVIDDGVLSQAELDFTVAAALARWEAIGLSATQRAHLDNARFTVADMSGLYLGRFAPGGVTLDSDGAGYGWFIDATPADDLEFANLIGPTQLRAEPWQAPAGRMDLLTTIMHEMGHQLGIQDSYMLADRASLMYGYLFTGERRLPGANDPVGAVAGSIVSEEFLGAPVNIGTLPGGKSVTIQWQSTIDAQTNQLITNPSNQGTVSGSNFASVLTDDPGVGGGSDPNVTPLDSLSVGNLVFHDVNRNGVFDAGDVGLDNVALTLFADTGSVAGSLDATDTVIATTVTAGGGLYSFTGLAPGTYIVRVDQGNFDAGQPLASLKGSAPNNPDPDDNVDNDDNGSGTPGLAHSTGAITLAYNTEPTNGPGNDTNNTLDIGVMNALPVANDDAMTTPENVVLGAQNVFSNNGFGADSDAEGDPFVVTQVNGVEANVGNPIALASGALLTLNADGTLTYNPNGKFDALPAASSGASNTTATDSFSYTITGGWSATVTVTVTGVDSNDTLEGTPGNDSLSGGIGSDTLTGGAGSDRFNYNSINDGFDTITDFSPGADGDTLDFSDVLVGYTQGTSNPSSFIQLTQSDGNTIVSVDADGTGGDFIALVTLQGVTGALLNDMIAQGNIALT